MADDGAGQPPVQQGRHVAVPGRGAAGEVVEQRGLEGRPRVERIERHEEPVTGARLDGRPCPTQGLGKRAARGHVLRQARHGPGVARRRSAHSGPVDQVIAGDDQEAVTSRLRHPGGAPAPVDVGRPGDPADRHAALGQYRFELAARGAREDPWLGDPGPPESQHRPRGQRQPSHDLRRAGLGRQDQGPPRGLSGVSSALPFRRIHSPEPLVGRRLPVSACRVVRLPLASRWADLSSVPEGPAEGTRRPWAERAGCPRLTPSSGAHAPEVPEPAPQHRGPPGSRRRQS